MEALTFSNIESGYAPKIAEIERLCFCDPWSESSVRSSIESGLCDYFGAFRDTVLTGYVSVIFSPDCAEIANLAVIPEFRRKGIAEFLMRSMITLCMKKNIEALLLDVRESNDAARRLYEKLGFEYVGRRRNYYEKPREDALLMTKTLAVNP